MLPRLVPPSKKSAVFPAKKKKPAGGAVKRAPSKRIAGAGPEKRIRRSAEDARAEILDAVERRMAEVGPAGIRLQDVARDVGVSHPTVLHHFGSREALIAAVVERNVGALRARFVAEIGEGRHGEEPITEMLEAAARVLGEGGHARLTAWLALSGYDGDRESFQTVEQVARATHALRTTVRGDQTPPFEDTYFVILLAALALFGDAIVGHLLRRSDDPAEPARFRAWLAGVIEKHLHSGGGPPSAG